MATCLGSPLPLMLFWGPALVQIYNDACAQLLGPKHPAALGQTAKECFPDLWEILGPLLQGVLETGQAGSSVEVLLVGEKGAGEGEGEGEGRYFTFRAGPAGAAPVQGVLCTLLEATGQALEEVDQAQTTFFSVVSHEFRTPLTLLLGPLELYQNDERLPEDVRTGLALADRNGRRVLRLVNSLLDISRLEAGRVAGTFQPTDLATMTADVAGLFRPAAEAAGVELRIRCDPLGHVVYVDREMWEQIVTHLCANALELTRQGSVTVRLFRLEDAARLEIMDTGIGIDPSELPHIFDRFRRGTNPGALGQTATGLGLALVRELVRLHGGTIELGSVPGEGTTVAVTVPFGTAHLEPARVASTAAPAPRTLSSSSLDELGLLPDPSPSRPDTGTHSAALRPRDGTSPASRLEALATAATNIITAESFRDIGVHLEAFAWRTIGVAACRLSLERDDFALRTAPVPQGSGTHRVVIPLEGADGSPLGRLELTPDPAVPLQDDDLELIRQMSQVAGRRIEHLTSLRHAHNVSHALQRSLLPTALPVLSGVELVARYRPGIAADEVGGDWYDALVLPDGRLMVTVGDVVGHDLDAAITMGQIRLLLRARALDSTGPGELCSTVEQLLPVVGSPAMATMALAFVALDTGQATFVNAGHPLPILWSSSGARPLDLPPSPPLGVVAGHAYRETVVQLPRRSTLLLYSDGLIERRDETLDDSLAKLLSRLDRLDATDLEPAVDTLLADHTGATADDVALLALRRR